jgi:fructose-1-phosphate kinase PfkB-like protein
MQKVFTITGNLLAETTSRFDMPEIGQTVRAIGASKFQVGGKGVNVARTLASLGIDCSAIVFPAGFIGQKCIDFLSRENFDVISISINGETREGLVCVGSNGVQTTFLGSDLPVPESAFETCLKKIEAQINCDDIVALCGSFPNWQTSYAQKLSKLCEEKKVYFCVDTYGAPLNDIADCHCDFLKFNKSELLSFLVSKGEKVDCYSQEIFEFARNKYFSKAKIFAITDGSNATFVSDKNDTIKITPQKIENEISATGCGDALFGVAISEIFIKKSSLKKSFERASKYATLTAECEETAVLSQDKIKTIF